MFKTGHLSLYKQALVFQFVIFFFFTKNSNFLNSFKKNLFYIGNVGLIFDKSVLLGSLTNISMTGKTSMTLAKTQFTGQ